MKIAIMSGHGGADPGATNEHYGQKEKDFNLKEAKALSDRLLKAGHEVKMCRDSDARVSLGAMQTLANDFGADICLCLHHNACASHDASGWEIYFNAERSRPFAETVVAAYKQKLSIGPHGGHPMIDSSTCENQRPHACIGSCRMPTVLLESCFIDNDLECQWLMNTGWEQTVDALYEAVCNYKSPVKPDHHQRAVSPHDLCEIYVDLSHEKQIELPGLMAITFAQWMLESGWCESELARFAYNFSGLKDRVEISMGGRYFYKGEYWEKFNSPEDFIRGYWQFLERSPYSEFHRHKARYANDPEGFIRCIGPTYCPEADYPDKVLKVYASSPFHPFRERLKQEIQGKPKEEQRMTDLIEKLRKWVDENPEAAQVKYTKISTGKTFSYKGVLDDLDKERDTGCRLAGVEDLEIVKMIEKHLEEL